MGTLHHRSPLGTKFSKNPQKPNKMPKGAGLTKPMKLSSELADIVGKKEASRRVHQAIVGLHQEEQPPRPREQAILRPRQEDGQGLRQRPHPRFRHGQVPLRSLVLSVQPLIHGSHVGRAELCKDLGAYFPVYNSFRTSFRFLTNNEMTPKVPHLLLPSTLGERPRTCRSLASAN